MRRQASLGIIFATIFIDMVGFGIVIPIMPFYAEHFGATGIHVGLLMSSFSLMQFIFAPIWGRLSDRIGRRPIILMSLIGSAITLLLLGLANSLLMLFAARIFAGIFMANLSAAQAYIADITTPEERAKGMGLFGAAFGLGFIFGPPIGGLLSDPALLHSIESFLATSGSGMSPGIFTAHRFAVPAYFAAALAIINTTAAFFLLPESRSHEAIKHSNAHKAASRFDWQNLKQALAHPVVILLLVLFFFITLAFTNLEATFALMTERNFGYDTTQNGWLFMYIGFLVALVQGGLIGPLTRRFGEGILLVTGLLMQGVAFLFLPYATVLSALLVILGVMSIGNGLSFPSLQSLISRNTDEDRQGGVLGLNQSLGSLARVLGPLWGGWFFDAIGVAAPYWSGGLLLLGCTMLGWHTITALKRNGL